MRIDIALLLNVPDFIDGHVTFDQCDGHDRLGGLMAVCLAIERLPHVLWRGTPCMRNRRFLNAFMQRTRYLGGLEEGLGSE
jgi:hypothetical protein